MSHKRPPSGYDFSSFQKRIEWINERSSLDLNAKERWMEEDLEGIIENPIGFVKMPIALCGPLLIDGEYAKGEFLIPFATVEGTLAISLTRGAHVANLSGGIKTTYHKQEIGRTPVFFFEELAHAKSFLKWLDENFTKIKAFAESTTRYGKLVRIDTYPLGKKILLDFLFTTGDAAGQNMVTIATKTACEFIKQTLEGTLPLHYFIESNFSGDKKPCHRNLIKGRGHSASATIKVSERIARKLFRVDAFTILKGANAGAVGSSLSGSIGQNLHTANALAGLYLATGQDVACVAENAGSIFQAEPCLDGSYEATVTLPSITIGTVGGGTRLKDQNTNLKMLGCEGENGARKFAEIIAACVLALEISLGSAIVSDEFVDAHQKYGRKGGGIASVD